MSYLIRLYDNTLITTVPDGQVDQSTSLNLIGRNVSGFGQYQNDNFVWLLENFAGASEPVNKLQGQIWFDNTAGILRPMAYDGTNWRPLGVTLYSTTSTDATINPSGAAVSANQPGDFWFKSDDQQLYVATSSSGYILVGPQRVPGFLETEWRSTSVADNSGSPHPVVELVINGEAIAVFSQKTFVSTSSLVATGFPEIYRGLTFKNYSASDRHVSTTTDVALYGIPNLLDTTYPQRDVNETIANTWVFQNGLQIGGTSGTASVIADDSSDNLNMTAAGPQLGFAINGGTTVATMLQEGIIPAGNKRQQLGDQSYIWSNIYSAGLSAGSAVATGVLDGQWQLTNNSQLVPFADLGNSLGSNGLRWQTVYASTINPGLGQQGLVTGNWRLDNGTIILPNTDYGNSLGSVSQRFDTIFSKTIDAGLNQPGNLIGEWSIQGDMLPETDSTYNLGAPGSSWKSMVVGDVQAVSVETNALTAQVATLTDAFSNSITRFDNDPMLTADEPSRIPTQYAVKNYVDFKIAQLQGEINALTNALNASINNFTAIPAGTIMHHGGSSAPAGFLICDGSTVATTSYPDLFTAIGYTYGGGGNQFVLPNLLGEFIRGWDMGRGVDLGRNLGSEQAGDLGNHSHLFDDVWYIQGDGNNPLSGNRNLDGSSGYPARNALGQPEPEAGFYTSDNPPVNDTSYNDGGVNDNAIWTIKNRTESAGTAGEVRPRNVELLPIIKFRNGS